ncbi:MAG: 1-acyl-sn-glycerol-3-phosphate acyltransferase [Anaerolineae bacterium]|nr:1-acyl-sn-glycerol-3-phosphate acyltransferase [Anaerolineae bacterium]MDW8173024.1 lysophospholipid acyltransferase family protein [Anaerolineae bacterium]
MYAAASVSDMLAQQALYDQRRRWLHRWLTCAAYWLVRVQVFHAERVPQQDGAILMMNHITWIDPALLTLVVRHRYVISMAKHETRHNPPVALVNRLWGNILVRRGEPDRVALNAAIELLRAKQLIMIAPEGTRNKQGLGVGRDGLAYVACKANALVVPSAVVGVHDWRERWRRLRRLQAQIHFGRPFRFVLGQDERLNKETRAAMTREAMYQLALAIPDEFAQYRGCYSDVENASTHYLAFA